MERRGAWLAGVMLGGRGVLSGLRLGDSHVWGMVYAPFFELISDLHSVFT